MARRQSLFIFSLFALILFLSFLFLSFPRTLAQQSKPDFAELEKVALAELAESNTPGAAIGIVSGRHYADQLEKRIFKPLGMARTTLRPTMAMTWPLAQGHDVQGREKPKVVRPAADNAGNWPAGSIFSSVQDLSRWVIALLHDGRIEGKQALSPTLFKQLSSPHAAVPGSDSRYGYGLMSSKYRGVRIVEHGGSRSGYGSLIRMAPDHRVAVIILVNRTGGGLPKTAEKALELMLPLEARVEKPKQPILMTDAERARYVGVYGNQANRVEIAIKDAKLWFKGMGREAEINKIGEMHFSTVSQPGAEFVLVAGASGKAEFLHLGGRTLSRIEP